MSNLEFAPTDIIRFPSITDSNSMTLAADVSATATTTANIPSNMENNNNDENNNNNNNLDINNINDVSIIFDSSEEEVQNDISASIDFSTATQFHLPSSLDPHQQNQFDPSSLQSHHQLQVQQYHSDQSIVPLLGLPLSSVFEDDCLPLVPPYNIRSNPSCSSASGSFLDASTGSYQLQNNLGSTMSAENAAMFHGNMFVGGNDMHNQDLDFHSENGGIFCTDPLSRIFNSNELQVINSSSIHESQHLVSGIGNSSGLASELTSLDDSTFKVGKLSAEQRKEKIHRYMKKRNERNFSKKIKYACRKTLADSRPRVRGRFAKNDEFGEVSRATCGSLDDDTCDDVAVKEEEDMVDSSDIFAHISGVNSLKCNYSIQSWI
ncbi:zinc finger protein HD1-like [Impatiens glandulifera]|uniref:zinc finger protein HD1-like n=1 Tax=Impatiens glandulifera TaxID=253017 RepID=UPI001FB05A0B|nr:zinc finger protein HD1-like [Impatiens glandulifera]